MQSIIVDGDAIIPSKIVCIGRNFAAHIAELDNDIPDSMVVFSKPNSAITDILHSQIAGQSLHYESELSFMVKNGKLAAVGFGLDLTKRELQSELKKKGLPWERAKAFDGAVVFSEFIAISRDIDKLSLQLSVDDSVRQEGGVNLMTYAPETILQELSSFITLEDGDVIMTGTPAGVGAIRTGEAFRGSVFLGTQQLVTASWVAQ